MSFIDNSIKTNWKYILIVVVLGLVVSGVLLLIFLNKRPETPSNECVQLEQEIDRLIQKANYCEVDSDCVVSQEAAYPLCGCPNLINKNADVKAIGTKKLEWEQNGCREDVVCEQCGPKPTSIICKANRCESF